MKLHATSYTVAGLLLTGLALQATPVTVTLGQSSQNFVQYGLGTDISGNPNWDLQQGACGFSGGITTCTLSGAFTGATAGFTSGTYAFVTTYSGNNIGSIKGVGEAPPNQNYFNYSYFSPSTSMVLDLMPTGGGTDVQTLVSGGAFVDSNFSFADTGTYTCSGTAVANCSPSGVGYVNGAIGQSPVITTVTFNVSSTITGTPEPRFLASIGLTLLLVAGISLRRNRAA